MYADETFLAHGHVLHDVREYTDHDGDTYFTAGCSCINGYAGYSRDDAERFLADHRAAVTRT